MAFHNMEEFVILGLVMILGLGAYWSLVIFPRQREFQKQQKTVRTMQVGDEIITHGGIIGRIREIDADNGIAYLDIADGVTIRVVTFALLHPYDPDELARNAQRHSTEGQQS
jgi:preprotein translocase subunit YajC